MALTLNEIERRVLGVLMEKALALPQYYPMTLNAIVTAANQKQNRDPVMDLDEDTVWTALERLRALNLVTRHVAGGGSRTDKFKHQVAETLGWQSPQRAVMAELLLRGPQTVGELKTRCARMTAIDSTDAVGEILQRLSEGDAAYVRMLARQPGQSAVRWTHTMYPPDEEPAADVATIVASPPMRPSGVATDGRIAALEEELAALRDEIRALRDELAQLRQRVEG